MFFFFNYNPYIAVIGDIKHSKKIKDRETVQEKLRATLNQINEKYAGDIVSKFTITLGDEFQGLLNSGANSLKIITEIENGLYPTKMRFGIGVGEILTKINPDLAIGADGPGYYEARNAIEYLRQNEKKRQAGVANMRLEIDGSTQGATELINIILSLMTVIKYAWTDRQRQTISIMLEHPNSQENIAKQLGVKQPSIHKILANGNYFTYKEAMDTVESALSEIRRIDV